MSGPALHIDSRSDLDENYQSILDMLRADMKLHFVDVNHTCENSYNYNQLLTESPSVKIITINTSVRHDIIILENAFENEHFNEVDDSDSDSSVEEQSISHWCPSCPVPVYN